MHEGHAQQTIGRSGNIGGRRRSGLIAVVFAFAAPALVAAAAALTSSPADAQTRRAGASAPRPPPAARGSTPKSDAGAIAPGTLTPAAPTAGAMVPAGPASDAGVVESKTLDGGTHVFKFSELDIEGRLKSPQLVYFLRRVRAEFAAGDLGHRTFMREMSETRKEPTF
jgi:hypothetical protein